MKENLKNLILKKKLNEKKPKYGKRKLSVGLVSCILAFSMLSPFLINTNLNVKADTVAGPVEPAPAPPPAPGDNGDNVFEGIILPKEVVLPARRLDQGTTEDELKQAFKDAIKDKLPQGVTLDKILVEINVKGLKDFNDRANDEKNAGYRSIGYQEIKGKYKIDKKESKDVPAKILTYALPFWVKNGSNNYSGASQPSNNIDKISVTNPNNYTLSEEDQNKIKTAFKTVNASAQLDESKITVDNKGNITFEDKFGQKAKVSSTYTVSCVPHVDDIIVFSKQVNGKWTSGDVNKTIKLKGGVNYSFLYMIQLRPNNDKNENMYNVEVNLDDKNDEIKVTGTMNFAKNADGFTRVFKVNATDQNDGRENYFYRDVSNVVTFRTIGIVEPKTIYRDIDEENKVTQDDLKKAAVENIAIGTTSTDDKQGNPGREKVKENIKNKISLDITDTEFNKIIHDTKKLYTAQGKLKYEESESEAINLKVRYFTKNFKVLVDDPKTLTSDDLNKIKAKAASVNGVDQSKVTVDNDGKVTITFEDGTKKDLGTGHVLKLNKPKLTKVKNKESLTEKEKADVIAAIKTANKDLSQDFQNKNLIVEFDNTGEVIVKDKYEEKLKNFTKDETVIALPALTNVDNTNSLTETEKNAVKAAIKKANTNLGDDVTIDVEANGKTIVKKGNDVLVEFEPNETIKEKDTPNVTIKQKDNGDLEIVVKDSENKAYPKGSTIAIKTGDGDTNADYINGKVVDEKGTVIIKNDKLPTEELKNKEFKALKDSVISKPVQVTVPKKLDFKVKEIEVEKGTTKDKIDAKNGLGENFSNSDKVKSVVFNQDSIPNTDTVTPNGTEPTKYKATVTFNDRSTTEIEIPVKVVDKTVPSAPTVTAEDDGSVKVTPPADTDAKEMTIKYKNDGEDKEITVTKGTDGKWKLPDSNPDGLTIDENGVVTIPENKVDDKTDVTAKAKDDSENESTEAKDTAKDKTAPSAPTVKAEDDGSVKVTPPADTDAKEMTIKYKNGNKDKEITVTKGTDGKWKLPDSNPDGLTIDEKGVVTIPENKVDDKTEVKAKAKDDSENESTEAKDTAKDKTAPSAPTVKAEDDGSVTVTPPADTDATEMTIKYKNDGEDKEITVTKGTDGKWKLPDSNPDGLTIDENGVVTIPEDKVDDKTDVTAKAKDDSGNESTEAKDTAKDKTAPSAPTVTAEDDGSVKVTPPTDADVTEVNVSYKNGGVDKSVKIKKGTDGKWKIDGENPDNVTVDETTGVVTIPEDKVDDKTEVKAKAKDDSENESTEAKAKAKSKPTPPAPKPQPNPSVPGNNGKNDNNGNKGNNGNNGNNGNTGSNGENNGENNGNVNTQKPQIKAPDKKVKVKDPNKLTKEEKQRVEKEIRDKNKDLPKDSKVEISDNGDVVVKDKDNKVIGKLNGKDLIEKKKKIATEKNIKKKLPKTNVEGTSLVYTILSGLSLLAFKRRKRK